jgi:hypothetical protein
MIVLFIAVVLLIAGLLIKEEFAKRNQSKLDEIDLTTDRTGAIPPVLSKETILPPVHIEPEPTPAPVEVKSVVTTEPTPTTAKPKAKSAGRPKKKK